MLATFVVFTGCDGASSQAPFNEGRLCKDMCRSSLFPELTGHPTYTIPAAVDIGRRLECLETPGLHWKSPECQVDLMPSCMTI